MTTWKITSKGYVQSAEKQTEHFEIYISKNEQETFYWLRVYQDHRIFSDYIAALSVDEACLIADKKIASYIDDQMYLLKLLKKELEGE